MIVCNVGIKTLSALKLARLVVLLIFLGVANAFTIASPKACSAFLNWVQNETIDAAWVIFRGSIVSYKRVSEHRASMTFKTLETYRGEKRDSWDVFWESGTFGVMKDIDQFRMYFGQDTVIGLRKPLGRGTVVTGDYAWVEAPWVKQTFCSRPFLVKWQTGNSFVGDFSKLVERGVIPNMK